MRSILWGRIVPLALTVIAAQSISMIGASAASGTDYDSFDAVTLNDVSATGAEVPYVGGVRDFVSAVFDSSAFTLDSGEAASIGGLHSCATPTGVSYAGRTAWVRFDPGTNGRISVVAETAGYDAVLIVRAAAEAPWRTSTLAHLESPAACADRTAGAGDESIADLPVIGDRVYFVQVGGRCSGAASTCQDTSTPGGQTRIRLRFTPYDTDADGVSDPRDNCEGQGTSGAVTADGCPDADLDGIADSADSCPRTPGVVAAPPFNGCPDGPRPPDPSNNPYVQIQSLSGDYYSTSSRRVVLHLNWPKGTTSAVIRNQRSRARVRAVGDIVDWRLTKGKKAGIRSVRVRFRGPGVPDVSVGDRIIFDSAKPELEASLVLESAQGWYVGLNLADRGTGISSLTLLDEEKQPIPDQQEVLCTPEAGEEEIVCKADEDLALTVPFIEPAYIEVVDVTGNTTQGPLVKVGSEKCAGARSESLPYKDSFTLRRCVTLQEPCRSLKPLLIWKVSDMRCRRVGDGTLRVVATR